MGYLSKIRKSQNILNSCISITLLLFFPLLESVMFPVFFVNLISPQAFFFLRYSGCRLHLKQRLRYTMCFWVCTLHSQKHFFIARKAAFYHLKHCFLLPKKLSFRISSDRLFRHTCITRWHTEYYYAAPFWLFSRSDAILIILHAAFASVIKMYSSFHMSATIVCHPQEKLPHWYSLLMLAHRSINWQDTGKMMPEIDLRKETFIKISNFSVKMEVI